MYVWQIQSTPPNTPALGNGEKRRYWKILGVIYNQERTYLGLENHRRYWGEVVNGGAVLGLTTV